MFDDIKDAELSLKSSVFIEEVVEDFGHWMTDLERIKKNPDMGLNVVFYSFLKSVLSFGFTLYRGDINKVKKMVDHVFLDIMGKLDDHAVS
jgi:hypothetical protein